MPGSLDEEHSSVGDVLEGSVQELLDAPGCGKLSVVLSTLLVHIPQRCQNGACIVVLFCTLKDGSLRARCHLGLLVCACIQQERVHAILAVRVFPSLAAKRGTTDSDQLTRLANGHTAIHDENTCTHALLSSLRDDGGSRDAVGCTALLPGGLAFTQTRRGWCGWCGGRGVSGECAAPPSFPLSESDVSELIPAYVSSIALHTVSRPPQRHYQGWGADQRMRAVANPPQDDKEQQQCMPNLC